MNNVDYLQEFSFGKSTELQEVKRKISNITRNQKNVEQLQME